LGVPPVLAPVAFVFFLRQVNRTRAFIRPRSPPPPLTLAPGPRRLSASCSCVVFVCFDHTQRFSPESRSRDPFQVASALSPQLRGLTGMMYSGISWPQRARCCSWARRSKASVRVTPPARSPSAPPPPSRSESPTPSRSESPPLSRSESSSGPGRANPRLRPSRPGSLGSFHIPHHHRPSLPPIPSIHASGVETISALLKPPTAVGPPPAHARLRPPPSLGRSPAAEREREDERCRVPDVRGRALQARTGPGPTAGPPTAPPVSGLRLHPGAGSASRPQNPAARASQPGSARAGPGMHPSRPGPAPGARTFQSSGRISGRGGFAPGDPCRQNL
jgi:hypothetical protein